MFSFFALALLAACQSTSDVDLEKNGVTAQTLSSMLGSASAKKGEILLIDARPPEEYAGGHINAAQNMGLERFPPTAKPDPRLERYGTIVVYGQNPGDVAARGLAKRLMQIGYDGVRYYAGGHDEWVRVFP